MYYDSIVCTDPSALSRTKTATAKTQAQKNYEYAPDWLTGGNGTQAVGDDFTTSATMQAPSSSDSSTTTAKGDMANGCTDGKDDGKLGFGETVGNFLWGAVKSVGNTIKDIVTDPVKLVKTVAIGAVCVAFPPAGVALGVAGAVTGVISGAKAIGRYASATSDDEAKQALQGMGSSALQIGVSVAGVKGSLNAMKATEGSAMANLTKSTEGGIKGTLQNAKNTGKAFVEDTVSGGKGFSRTASGKITGLGEGQGYKGTQMVSNVAKNVKNEGVIKGAKQSVADGVEHVKDARATKTAQKQASKYEKMDAEHQTKFDETMAKDLDGAQKAVTEAKSELAKLEEGTAEYKAAEAKLASAEKVQTKLQNQEAAFKEAQANLEDLKTAQAQAKTDIENAQKHYDITKENLARFNKGEVGYDIGKEALEQAANDLRTAKTAYSQATTQLNMASSNPIKSYPASFNNFAQEGGYKSGFGALTVPVAAQMSDTNKQQNATFGSVTAQATSNYVPGSYKFELPEEYYV